MGTRKKTPEAAGPFGEGKLHTVQHLGLLVTSTLCWVGKSLLTKSVAKVRREVSLRAGRTTATEDVMVGEEAVDGARVKLTRGSLANVLEKHLWVEIRAREQRRMGTDRSKEGIQ